MSSNSCATAGVLSEEESVAAPQYSQEEMNAAVEEAAMWGKKVAAHAHGTEGIKHGRESRRRLHRAREFA